MFVKIMSDDGLADKDHRKKFTLIEVVELEVFRSLESGTVDSVPFISYRDKLGKEGSGAIYGNVYIMNDQGKTIETWSPNK